MVKTHSITKDTSGIFHYRTEYKLQKGGIKAGRSERLCEKNKFIGEYYKLIRVVMGFVDSNHLPVISN